MVTGWQPLRHSVERLSEKALARGDEGGQLGICLSIAGPAPWGFVANVRGRPGMSSQF